MKKILVLTLVLAMGIGTATAFADTPSEILEDLSGVTQVTNHLVIFSS